jgi:2-polyprenyl-6-methoxyphenol hydroxylase-like FAD-dependent oxidoreductase
MNTGIDGGINLAWKLKAVFAGGASEALLDTYGGERIAFAQCLVETTDRSSRSRPLRAELPISCARESYRSLFRHWVNSRPCVISCFERLATRNRLSPLLL